MHAVKPLGTWRSSRKNIPSLRYTVCSIANWRLICFILGCRKWWLKLQWGLVYYRHSPTYEVWGYIILDLMQFFKVENLDYKHFETYAVLILSKMKAWWEEYCWAITQATGWSCRGRSGFISMALGLTQPLTEMSKDRGKAVPLQAWSGQEGSRRLRLPDFVTTAQDGGSIVSLTHRPPLPPGNTPGTHFC